MPNNKHAIPKAVRLSVGLGGGSIKHGCRVLRLPIPRSHSSPLCPPPWLVPGERLCVSLISYAIFHLCVIPFSYLDFQPSLVRRCQVYRWYTRPRLTDQRLVFRIIEQAWRLGIKATQPCSCSYPFHLGRSIYTISYAYKHYLEDNSRPQSFVGAMCLSWSLLLTFSLIFST